MSARLHRLGNGVTVACDSSSEMETFALSVVVRGGARWEGEAESGWSHLLEHMVFKGAGGRSAREIVETAESAGASVNAATGYERTSFQVRGLKGSLPLGMDLTGALVLRPHLEADELAREQQVVVQEIAEARDTPDDHVFELAQSRAFHGHPLGRPILGTEGSVGSATPEALAGWRGRLYAPERICVSAAGAVDEDELLALTEAVFGDQSASSEQMASPERAEFVGGQAAERRRLEQAHLVLQLPGVGARDDDYFAFRLFAEALGGGMASRLFQEARERLGLAYSIDAYAEAYEDAGLLGIYAGTGAGDAAKVAEIAAREIEALAEAPGEAELARAKAQLKSGLFMARESATARAEQAAGQAFLFGRTFSAREIAEEIDAVTAEDFSRLGARLTEPRRYAAAVLGPKAASGAGEAFGRALFG